MKLYLLDDRDVRHLIMSFINPFKFSICLPTDRSHSCWAHRTQPWNKILKASETAIIIATGLVLIFTFSLEILDINCLSHRTLKIQSIIKELKSDLTYFTTSIRYIFCLWKEQASSIGEKKRFSLPSCLLFLPLQSPGDWACSLIGFSLLHPSFQITAHQPGVKFKFRCNGDEIQDLTALDYLLSFNPVLTRGGGGGGERILQSTTKDVSFLKKQSLTKRTQQGWSLYFELPRTTTIFFCHVHTMPVRAVLA